MAFKTELFESQAKVLIIDKHGSPLLSQLKDELKKYDYEVYVSPTLGEQFSKFDAIFVLSDHERINSHLASFTKRCTYITSNKKLAHWLAHKLQQERSAQSKVIQIPKTHHATHDDIQKLFWFSFGRTHEVLLELHPTGPKVQPTTPTIPRISLVSFLRPRFLIVLTLSFLLILHTLFIPPLLYASFLHYRATQALRTSNWEQAVQLARKGSSTLATSRSLYGISRSTFQLFGLLFITDSAFELNERVNTVIKTASRIQQEVKVLLPLITNQEKTDQERATVSTTLTSLRKDLLLLEEDGRIIYQKLPDWPQLKTQKEQLRASIATFDAFSKFLPEIESMAALGTEKKYLFLFANNMELRPGGGFIGSFATVTFKDFSLKDMKVYDVYDADGQLSEHIDPPTAIAQHLQQPHWFLRDSAFSPDFPENFKRATFFLEKELPQGQFDGGVLVTTTAIQNMLAAAGDIYIPDFKEIVNKDNFYLKAQLYAEKDFFPGSTQKKRFLASVMNQLLINADTISLPIFFDNLKKSLDEKQIALYFADAHQQSLADSLYWSGRIIEPRCATTNDNCITDYLFPLDANLGVNKANFFVNRNFDLKMRLNPDGSLTNTLRITYKNDSPNEVFPGGPYKNYIQLLLPRDAYIKTLTQNGTLIENYDETVRDTTILGFITLVKPQATTQIEVTYEIRRKLQSGQASYQLVFQKQIGSKNSDISFELTLPSNIYIVNQNFTPLVKGNVISYNTTLSADKIFYIDLAKE